MAPESERLFIEMELIDIERPVLLLQMLTSNTQLSKLVGPLRGLNREISSDHVELKPNLHADVASHRRDRFLY